MSYHPLRSSQAVGARAAIDLFRRHSYRAYDWLVYARHDVKLTSDPAQLRCQSAWKIGIAGRCESKAWESYRCVNDVLFVVPKSQVAGFAASIGSSTGAGNSPDLQCGCFEDSCADK